MEYNCEPRLSLSPNTSRTLAGIPVQKMSPRKQMFKSAFARSLNAQFQAEGMPHQSTPVAFKKFEIDRDFDLDFNCARTSLDSEEIQVSRINLTPRSKLFVHGQDQGKNDDMESLRNIILESEVEKLKWQLELAENNRTMYHELMEEMVRFLQRCNRDLVESEDSSDSSSSTGKSSSQSSENSLKSNESSGELADSSSTASYLKYKEYYNSRSAKRKPEQSVTARLSKEAFRLLRIAQNLINTNEPDLRQPVSTPKATSRQSVAQSPRSSSKRKSIFQLPTKETVNQWSSDLFWEKADGRSPRLSLPLIKPEPKKEAPASSTEDEGIGGSVRSVASKPESKPKDVKRTGTYRKFLSKRNLLKHITSVGLISTK